MANTTMRDKPDQKPADVMRQRLSEVESKLDAAEIQLELTQKELQAMKINTLSEIKTLKETIEQLAGLTFINCKKQLDEHTTNLTTKGLKPNPDSTDTYCGQSKKSTCDSLYRQCFYCNFRNTGNGRRCHDCHALLLVA